MYFVFYCFYCDKGIIDLFFLVSAKFKLKEQKDAEVTITDQEGALIDSEELLTDTIAT